MSAPEKQQPCLHLENNTEAPKAITETALPFSPADEKRLVRKLDRTILPWIMLLYLLSYIDRSNMGNARNIGLEEDIGLSSVQYQIASASFYIGHRHIRYDRRSDAEGREAFYAACVNPGGLIAVRFFLGVFEASFAPGCALYLSFWYLKSELSLRIAAYAGMSALSGVISGVVAYSMGLAKNMAVTSWQGLFLVEGLPTIAVGAATFWMLPGRPESGKSFWFTDEEHQIILNRRSRFTRNADEGISKAQVKAAFLDYRLYLFCVMYSGLSLSLAVAAVFLPTIVKDLGYHSVQANLMTAPIYAVAYVTLLVTATLSDRFRTRGIPISIGGLIAGTGYICLGLLKDDLARYVTCFLAVTGTYMAFPIVLTWITSTFAGDTKAGVGLGIVIAVTHAVGVAASNIYPKTDAPYYLMGNAVSSSLVFLTALSAVIMSVMLYRENRHRDRRFGRPEADVPIDMGGDADKAQDYRYEI
ncbi:hypothetical protein FOXG_20388 [Fusarium oxysporum f. sp. lycopersici 4287]|uniref:Major facilitator superfamily (MFS) profile domain-containing protein n=1 Tax=Fusarium oxysporum f. sp. lycopersici (strain 4287 / CBS 123668 / FGSC 9935 / NRRL 34936) TaxID=426428 RepID=A0A0J9VIV8_FUSO4|nr:hypothetical protein FOXG_20388 [Fusarium oxysporum f. sp. lycopersici 4287]KNB10696.1 hypothetical protein FOXG_20388 [Fusarium oxysporum f. sp. lycopersici 4287]